MSCCVSGTESEGKKTWSPNLALLYLTHTKKFINVQGAFFITDICFWTDIKTIVRHQDLQKNVIKTFIKTHLTHRQSFEKKLLIL